MATPAPACPHVLFTAVRSLDGRTCDLLVSDGRIAAYDPAELPDGCLTVDAAGALALPSPVDAHIHPDKSTWGGPWLSREPAGTLRDLIEGDVRARTAFTTPVEERAGALMDRAIARGTRAMRAHVDVAPVHGLSGVHGVRAAADARKDLLDVQIVAFPQLGLLSEPGTADLMEQALSEGADVVGGLDPIGIDDDMDGQLDFVFGLAARKRVPVDIHLHDGGPAGLRQVTEIARRTVAAGMQGRVTLGHAFAVAELGATNATPWRRGWPAPASPWSPVPWAVTRSWTPHGSPRMACGWPSARTACAMPGRRSVTATCSPGPICSPTARMPAPMPNSPPATRRWPRAAPPCSVCPPPGWRPETRPTSFW